MWRASKPPRGTRQNPLQLKNYWLEAHLLGVARLTVVVVAQPYERTRQLLRLHQGIGGNAGIADPFRHPQRGINRRKHVLLSQRVSDHPDTAETASTLHRQCDEVHLPPLHACVADDDVPDIVDRRDSRMALP